MAFIQNLFTSRDNNANSATNVGQQDRLWWDPVTNRFYYSDGNTPGGFPVGGGNVTTDRLVNGAYELVLDATGNVTAPGAISAVGNVTANYFVGNGSQLTGINVSANKIFNGNSYANVAAASGNVEINANGQSWLFGTSGNLTLPGNTVSINYANGTPYGGGGSSLPPQTGNVGKILSTNGTNPLWTAMPGVFGLVIDGGSAAYVSTDFIIDGGTAA